MATKATIDELERIARQMRHHILVSTTGAGSGHPTSSLSAADLMAGLLFGDIFRYDIQNPGHPNNDRLIFSKGHASPLLYALWAAAGVLSADDLQTYRRFGSPLEGHPTPRLSFVEAATGSLGQGLSIGVGIALNAKYLDRLPYRTYVLLGDSEMAEGSQWEAVQIAAHYHLENLVGILDVNRLGQRGETMYGHDLDAYARRLAAFGWEPIQIDGHSFPEILSAYRQAAGVSDRPVMIVARTIKGKGVSLVEDLDGWHGKALDEKDLQRALDELGPVDRSLRGRIAAPADQKPEQLFPRRSTHRPVMIRKAKFPRAMPTATP
jgi:transketolase